MPKKINYTLTTEELQQVQEVISKHDDARVKMRAQMIYMLHLGNKPDEVAEVLCTTNSSVYTWHKRWRESGIAGLEEKARSGRPPIGGEAYKRKLEEVMQSDPHDLGYGFSVWTAERLIQHMGKETDVYMSENTLLSRLQELSFVYRRPKHDLGNLQDVEAKKQAENMISELKKRQNQAKSNFSLWTKQP